MMPGTPHSTTRAAKPQPQLHLLLYTRCTGYKHTCIPAAVTAFQSLGHHTVVTEDPTVYFRSADALTENFDVVVLLHCIGDDIFTPTQLASLRGFLNAGGGVVAVHGAAAAMTGDEWYGRMVGAHFDSHPDPEPGMVIVEESSAGHEILAGLAGLSRKDGWVDEWYNFRRHPRDNANLKILLRGDPKSFKGGKMGEDHPLSWCQEFEGGRVWFTALGHFDEAYEDEWFMGMVERGIVWAAAAKQAGIGGGR
ncbi:uncharacterized protein AB675_3532 [Cyphellophora attinorum]|uniref:ThuA-like domain-containing protein n=1 Tax=Cyphellophora attinorum TaxID=1664694 RepID=A0A0N0NLQ9_9EURO|nr:uncharacterized protein AB675_3532 [Phialophora attinorum]KPI39591.1 hypothetical protein AB675_3532 [Phialophora attinorum]